MILPHFSASQFKMFQECPRSWFYSYVLGIKKPETESMLRGKRIHKQLEKWFTLGTPVKHKGALKALSKLPKREDFPKTLTTQTLYVEEDLGKYLTRQGIGFKGAADLVVVEMLGDFWFVHIYDYKTTGDVQTRKESEDALRQDIQGNVYAEWARTRWPGAQVKFTHVYIPAAGDDEPDCVTVDLTPGNGIWEMLDGYAAQMVTLAATVTDALKVTGNQTACGNYAGCPRLKDCYPKTSDRMAALLSFSSSPKESTAMKSLSELANANTSKTEAPKPHDPTNPAHATRTQAPAPSVRPPDAPAVTKPPVAPEVATATAAPVPGLPSATPLVQTPLELDRLQNKALVQAAADEARDTAKGFRLLVNVAPAKGVTKFTRLEDLIAQHSAALLTEHKVADLRLIPYGHGVAYLVAAFRRNPPTGTVIATRGGQSDAVIEALYPLATQVLEGVR